MRHTGEGDPPGAVGDGARSAPAGLPLAAAGAESKWGPLECLSLKQRLLRDRLHPSYSSLLGRQGRLSSPSLRTCHHAPHDMSRSGLVSLGTHHHPLSLSLLSALLEP